MQSFENSSKQLQRRQERQLALERMQEAANLVDEEQAQQKQQQQQQKQASQPQHIQGNIDNQEEEVSGFEDYPWNRKESFFLLKVEFVAQYKSARLVTERLEVGC